MILYCCCSSQQYKLQLTELLETCAACGTAQSHVGTLQTTAVQTALRRLGRSQVKGTLQQTVTIGRHIQHKQQRRLFAVHQVVSQQAVNESHLNIRMCTHVTTACTTIHTDCSTGWLTAVYSLYTGNVCTSWIQSQTFRSNIWGP
jgi:hypothetical protein